MNTSPIRPPFTCAEFEALLPDYLEEHALSSSSRAAADAHLDGCGACTALTADLRSIARQARDLPLLTPSRDLWSGVASRIEAPVVALPTAAIQPRGTLFTWRRMAVAAGLLVAATAGTTWTIAMRGGAVFPQARSESPGAPATAQLTPAPTARLVAHASATETFDREIASLRTLVDARRSELDPVTVGIIEKNLRLIDHAIAESKAALAADPASAFLADRLTHAYDSKLQLLRDIATRPPRS